MKRGDFFAEARPDRLEPVRVGAHGGGKLRNARECLGVEMRAQRTGNRRVRAACYIYIGSKVARTSSSDVKSNMHPVDPRQRMSHSRNEPFSGGAATMVIEVPGGNAAVQIPGQSIPGGIESTRPGPTMRTAIVREAPAAGAPACPQAMQKESAAAATIVLTAVSQDTRGAGTGQHARCQEARNQIGSGRAPIRAIA